MKLINPKVYALIIVAIALTAISTVLAWKKNDDNQNNLQKRLIPMAWENINEIIIIDNEKNENNIYLKKNNKEKWIVKIDKENFDLANQQVIEEIEALVTLAHQQIYKQKNENQNINIEKNVIIKNSYGDQHSIGISNEIIENKQVVTIDNQKNMPMLLTKNLLKFVNYPKKRWKSNELLALGNSKIQKISLKPSRKNRAEEIVLEKIKNEWKIIKPIVWNVDDAKLDRLIRALASLQIEETVNVEKKNLEIFGINEDSDIIEINIENNDEIYNKKIYIGDQAGENAKYIKVNDRSPVFVVAKQAVDELPIALAGKYPDEWVNFYKQKKISLINEKIPDKIIIEKLIPEKEILTIENKMNKWIGIIEKNNKKYTFKIDTPEKENPDRPLAMMMTGLSILQVKNFVKKEDSQNLTKYPAIKYKIEDKKGNIYAGITLYAKNEKGDVECAKPYQNGIAGPVEMICNEKNEMKKGIIFTLDGASEVMETYDDFAYLLDIPFYRYQSVNLTDYEIKDWDELTIENKNGKSTYKNMKKGKNEQWWKIKPEYKPLIDDNHQMIVLLITLAKLKAEAIVDINNIQNQEKYGLKNPEIKVTITGKNKKNMQNEKIIQINIGKKYPEENVNLYYANINDNETIFLLNDEIINAINHKYE